MTASPKNHVILIAAVVILTCCTVFAVFLARKPNETKVVRKVETQTSASKPAESAEAAAQTEAVAPPSAEPTSAFSTTSKPASKTRNAAAPKTAGKALAGNRAPAGGGGGQKQPLRDPAAREALSYVGADPAAEQYWMQAINDPAIPPEERQDLIEDLNEDGLSDPHAPGIEDLPLIIARLELIENLGPDAMDKTNADAFQEAYKDLVNMLAGEPIQ